MIPDAAFARVPDEARSSRADMFWAVMAGMKKP
jgi:hypothetical protein